MAETDAEAQLVELALFGCVDGIGRRTLRKVLKYRKQYNWDWRDIWVPSAAVCTFLSLSKKQIESIQKCKKEQHYDAIKKGLQERRFRLVGTESMEYPPLLREADDPPPVLFVKGATMHWPTGALAIAVVGTRNCTAYGKAATEKIVSELSDLGAIIVSGLMYGIDTIAHLTAIRAKGRTIAVLGYGFDHCYPEEHRPVLAKLLAGEATFISEYPPWNIAKKGNFPARNSIVAAMSAAVVVTEAAQQSGSMITAQCANDEGRTVFAVPGPITNPYCEGTKWLINEGATLISSGLDIINELYQLPHQSAFSILKKGDSSTAAIDRRRSTSQVSDTGQRILDSFGQFTSGDLELLQSAIGGDQQTLLVELSMLEMSLLVERLGDQWRLCGAR